VKRVYEDVSPDTVPTQKRVSSDGFDVADFHDAIDTHVSEATPFSFFLYEDSAGTPVHGDASVPVAFAECEDPLVYRWLEGLYEECLESAHSAERLL